MPITAGILVIFYGTLGIGAGYWYILADKGPLAGGDLVRRSIIIGVLFMILGILAIAGGGFALKKRYWILSLIGASVVLFTPIPFIAAFWTEFDMFSIYSLINLTAIPPVIAIILIILSRKQFDSSPGT